MRASRLSLDRRRSGAIVLAVISIAALVRLRSTCESLGVIAIETALHAALVGATGWIFAISKRSGTRGLTTSQRSVSEGDRSGKATITRNPQTFLLIGGTVCVLFPIVANFLARQAGGGTGEEIAYLGALAWGGLVAALFAQLNRTLSISVVCSGFLTLFTTVSSDHHQAVYIAFLWGMVCLWWLIANHWERVEACQIDSVKSTNMRTPLAIIAGGLVFVIAAWTASGRSVMFSRPSLELVQTSGGSGRYDAAARSGVGNGDAVVAARDHAASFGAVDTDVFLDSPMPSLFDIFNDQFGEPVRKKKTERAIALAPRDTRSTSSRTAQSNSSTQSFTTRRSEPKPRQPLKDVRSNATMFWIGRVGERLATERYTRFDGTEWHQELQENKPTFGELKIGERVWFSTDANSGLATGPYADSVAEAVKFTRFRSNRIPTPAGVQMWHIDLVDKADFFGFTGDHCLEMPGRDHVPDYTTVRLVSRLIDREKLEALTSASTGAAIAPASSEPELPSDRGVQLAKQIAREWLPNSSSRWADVQLLVERLRSEFAFDRSGSTSLAKASNAEPGADPETESDTALDEGASTPLETFLMTRRGNDVMFATAAAVMLRELGFPTRLVTGFYVDPNSYDRMAGQTPITAADAHAWLEVNIGADTWIPLEPTPGYRTPTYRTTWLYLIKRNASMIAGTVVGLLSGACLLWLSRAYLFECLLRIASYFPPVVSDRRRVRFVVGVLDRRCRFAGIARPRSISPREWLLRNLALDRTPWSGSLNRFFNEADQLNYGGGGGLSAEGRKACKEIWREASTFYLRRLRPHKSTAWQTNKTNETVSVHATTEF